ncbi:MAG: SDR family oxidoreductase [Planctomycetes bacterium]|nr:SDR family oxidoreductase [Planctomycetota bacterium]
MYLVTGGAGFIGSHIVEELVRQGKKVRVLDNFSAGRMSNIAAVRGKIDLIHGDIRDTETVCRAMRKVKYVLHQAALKSVPESLLRPAEFNDVNVNGTFNLLMAAQTAKVKRFLFASSSSVYGDARKLPVKESDNLQPISPYGATKVISEMYCRNFSQTFGLETVIVRYFNVFGPRQDPASPYAGVIAKFIIALAGNKRPVIFGDGRQSRDFTYIDNVVSGTLKALTARLSRDKTVFNIACGRPYTVLEMTRLLTRILAKHIKPAFKPPRAGDIRHSYADVSLAKRLLKYRSKTGFAQGLSKTVRYFTP